MQKHVEILGWLYIILDSIGVLVGIGIFLFFSGLSVLPDDAMGSAVLGIIGVVVGNLIIWTSIPGIIGGIGLLKRKNWQNRNDSARSLLPMLQAHIILDITTEHLILTYFKNDCIVIAIVPENRTAFFILK